MAAVRSPRVRRAGRIAIDIALGGLATFGVLCGAALVAGVVLQLTPVLFASGSMAPAIPAGSVAIVQRIPASTVRLGDVVTVDRAAGRPVTHRVVAIQGSGATRTLRLKGDANREADPVPYVVTTVRIVRWSAPGLANVIVWFRNPFVLGGLSVVAASIVVWAFWPRARRWTAAVVLVIGIAGIAALTPDAPARAADLPAAVTSSTYLRVDSEESPEMADLTPGSTADWQVGVATVDPPGPGTVHVGLGLDGSAGDAASLAVSMLACSTRFIAGACSSGARVWLAPSSLAASTAPATAYAAREHGATPSDTPVWVLVRVSRDAASTRDVRATLRLQVWAFGDSLSAGDSIELAGTGPGAMPILAGLGVGSVGTGLAMRTLERRRRR